MAWPLILILIEIYGYSFFPSHEDGVDKGGNLCRVQLVDNNEASVYLMNVVRKA
jgi:hypothetical protein